MIPIVTHGLPNSDKWTIITPPPINLDLRALRTHPITDWWVFSHDPYSYKAPRITMQTLFTDSLDDALTLILPLKPEGWGLVVKQPLEIQKILDYIIYPGRPRPLENEEIVRIPARELFKLSGKFKPGNRDGN